MQQAKKEPLPLTVCILNRKYNNEDRRPISPSPLRIKDISGWGDPEELVATGYRV